MNTRFHQHKQQTPSSFWIVHQTIAQRKQPQTDSAAKQTAATVKRQSAAFRTADDQQRLSTLNNKIPRNNSGYFVISL